MSYKGNKIAARLRQHAEQGVAADMELVLKALSKGPLRNLHFDTAKRYMHTTSSVPEIVIQSRIDDSVDAFPHQNLAQRSVESYLAYMAVSASDSDKYSPAIERIIVSQKSLMLFDRIFPLELHASHLEFRHIQRSTNVLNYEDDPFRFAVAFSLLLSKVLESRLPESFGETVPIVIPQPKGLFLGYARRVSSTSYMPRNSIVAIYDEDKTKQVWVQSIPEWLPTVAITAKTYIHLRAFSGAQRRLHQILMPFFDEPEKTAILGRFVDSYVIGTSGYSTGLRPHEQRQLSAVTHELSEIVQDPIWQTEAKRAAAKFARKDLN